ncbi:cell wall metabolism sensor histidine kinase WalK [Ancylomarina sp. 16SWW S1-10-2]|uniref:sensor histidine kinase n=1 Tax=Ancylomarina sp. 16SWW S1-10-2 TaxID=2499681 RepID=UPI0012AE0C86|nr:ATP-binding protein [Ancylomarina sp. 16SWW S1-10-2]MRT93724.1 hypothetical protein [Ancylomarina sp. 16SWW S1-10-2]
MQKNRLNRKKFKIVSPMILSMILLITFVAYWLHSQYYNEKETLQIELSQLYYNTTQDAEFILYYQSTIKPALNFNDSLDFNQLKIGNKDIDPNQKQAYVEDLTQFIDANKKLYNELFDAIENKQIIPEHLKKDFQYYNLYTIGYKYQIYNRTNLDLFKQTEAPIYVLSKSLYIKSINKKFQGLKISSEKQIIDVNLEDYRSGNKAWIKKGELEIVAFHNRKNKMLIFQFENYFLYLIAIILPQIIFAFILIGFSFFALLFAYRSYLTQERLNLLRSDFVSNITHELKIPVATAKAAMEAILNFGITDDKEKTKSYLNMVALEMNRLDNLTTRVLEHSRLENNQHPLHKEETEMNLFVERIVESVQLFYADSINIKYNNTPDSIYIPIDQVYIEGVIRNLIENSKKYGGNDVNITVSLWKKDLHIYVSVVDDGPGIPKKYLTKVFDRFFRVPTGDKHNVKGFGLGLSFAALVMKQHNGSIKANNLPDSGCEFTLKFPA